MQKIKGFIVGIFFGLLVVSAIVGGAYLDRTPVSNIFDKIFPNKLKTGQVVVQGKIFNEESVVIDVVNNVGPSVVTVGIIQKPRQALNYFDPFDFFGYSQPDQQSQKPVEQDIGSGFILSKEGLIVTNKHVVSDTSASYKVYLSDSKSYPVEKIYRDPANDLAIIKITAPAGTLRPVEMGDSTNLKVGQFVIAIGTALGEFRNTVTTGVVSGLGRGISAGSPFQGFVENLDNVIQTDAAINPGNSGGPLLNSAGQVIGINAAVAQGAQNIGFAIPINIVKQSLDNFNSTGQFSRPFLGVRSRQITKAEAVAKNWVEGAGVVEVVSDSPADIGGIKAGDIITKIDNEAVTENNSLPQIIGKKKVSQVIKVTVWRNEKEETLSVTLKEAS